MFYKMNDLAVGPRAGKSPRNLDDKESEYGNRDYAYR